MAKSLARVLALVIAVISGGDSVFAAIPDSKCRPPMPPPPPPATLLSAENRDRFAKGQRELNRFDSARGDYMVCLYSEYQALRTTALDDELDEVRTRNQQLLGRLVVDSGVYRRQYEYVTERIGGTPHSPSSRNPGRQSPATESDDDTAQQCAAAKREMQMFACETNPQLMAVMCASARNKVAKYCEGKSDSEVVSGMITNITRQGQARIDAARDQQRQQQAADQQRYQQIVAENARRSMEDAQRQQDAYAEQQRQQQELQAAEQRQAIAEQQEQLNRDRAALEAQAQRLREARDRQGAAPSNGPPVAGATSPSRPATRMEWRHYHQYSNSAGGANVNYSVYVQNTGTAHVRCDIDASAEPAGYGHPSSNARGMQVAPGRTVQMALLGNIRSGTGRYEVSCRRSD